MEQHLLKKMIVVAAVIALALVAFGCGGDEQLTGNVAAQVGDTEITVEELDERVAQYREQLGAQAPTEENEEAYQTFRQQVLEYMVALEIVRQKSEDVGVEITDEDIEARVDEVRAMTGDDEEAFLEGIAAQNLSEEQLRSNLREEELISRVAEQVTADVEVTDEEVERYYEENQESFEVPETRATRHILISPGDVMGEPGAEATEEEWEAALQEAEQVRQEILDGADFSEMAREHSDDEGSAEQGGDLGDVLPGTMVPEFDEKVFSMDVGDVSEPVRTDFGYHIIQVEEENPPRTHDLEEVRDSVRSQLLDEKKAEEWNDWLEKAGDELGVTIADDLEDKAATEGMEEPAEATDTTDSAN